MINKKKICALLLLISVAIIPQITLASAISLRSSKSSIEPSKIFSLSIYVNPSSVASYTAGANIKFPSDLVSIESFSYSSSWIPITTSGYDSIDNVSGRLIKTAGYPGGFNSEVLLGTAIFKSKKAGAITISTDKESYVLDIDSNNTLTIFGSFSITSSTPVVDTPKAPITKTTPPVTKTIPLTKEKEVSKTSEVVETNTEIIPEPTPTIITKDKSSVKKIVLFLGVVIGVISAYLGFH